MKQVDSGRASATPVPIRAVLFDLDGTLIDSVDGLRVAMNRVLAERGRRPIGDAEARRFVGDGAERFVARSLAATGGGRGELAPALGRFVELYEASSASFTTLYPGVREILDDLAGRGLRLGLCTNKPLAATRKLLDALGILNRFDTVVGGDSYPERKPSPVPVLGALQRLDVPPEAAVFVGDNEHDVTAARAAGMALVLVVVGGYARVPLNELTHDGALDGIGHLPARLFGSDTRLS